MCKILYILIQKNSQKYNTAKYKNMGTLTIENVKKVCLMTMALICLESLTRIDSRLADDWRTKSSETV